MKASQIELFDIYDREGQFQNRTVERGQTLADGDFHLVVQVWIGHKDGRFLIQKRAENLKNAPGVWATTAGHVLAGETAIDGAVRELEEEMGISAVSDELIEVYREITGQSHSVAFFLEKEVQLNDVTIQIEEVSAVKWETADIIQKMIASGEFYDYGNVYMKTVFRLA